ncbi:MAG: glycoside hydrolase family 2 TIM barrel-domain containing protein [Opitutaceae bacterium]|nr:glycoside hydrolase family 2 TIM barrel-domain containing protein [Opitutaceae bacterium]
MIASILKTKLASAGVVLLVGLAASRPDVLAQARESKEDKFAQIAGLQTDSANRNLISIAPMPLTRRWLSIDAAGTTAAFQPAVQIATAEQLREELQRQRERYAPYLQDLAPQLDDLRIRVPVESFDWRVETEDDRRDFAGTLAGQGKWQQVRIPHYGPPMGRAVTYYRTTFEVTPAMLAKGALFVHFNGVDYKAHVFVNGAFLGSHEGYFAPFEFEFTTHARLGRNTLVVKVLNDYIMLGNSADRGFLPGGKEYEGDKIYACGGPGWDEPMVGWHECPPGMGVYQDVTIEARRRIHLHDVFVRPLGESGKAEAWIEVFNCDPQPAPVAIEVSVAGQNFRADVLRGQRYRPPEVAMGGVNCWKIPLTIAEPRPWEPDTPWLYQLQVRLLDGKGNVLDTMRRQFGLRTFRMEYAEEPKGRMFLNGKGIKLRGANTMGAFQQCVIRKDWQQLIDDILLAKITHLNYIRLTQTPVQPEIYEYCDRLGLMLQTDLPLFGNVKRNQFCEVVRQAEEMEKLVRPHPSNILVTYINEPFPDASGNPQRNLTREELGHLFKAADTVVHMANPDQVIKAVDGDYDPPGPGMPDNHCYCGWYNGHGVDLGALYKGYWQRVKPGWVYGCGEFGAEGLDPAILMHKRYPKDWLPQTAAEDQQWTPSRIPGAQTGEMHDNFFETPQTLAGWVQRSQAHQALIIRLMTEAFRRDPRMHSFAVHLFIDAFPSGWMKSLMDCEREPKPAWFAYRDALTPLAVNLRTDRRAFFAGEPIEPESWICNDLHTAPPNATLHYQLEQAGKVLQAGSAPAAVPLFDSAYQGTIPFRAPPVASRTTVTVRLGLLDADGRVLHDTAIEVAVFPRAPAAMHRVYVIGSPRGKAAQLAGDLGANAVFEGPIDAHDAILIDDFPAFGKVETQVAQAVRAGAQAVFLELTEGKYQIAQTEVVVGGTPRKVLFGEASTGLHFVSRATGHRFVEGFQPDDFKFWYDARVDHPAPLLNMPGFRAAGWEPVLLTHQALAAGSKAEGKGQWCICQVELADRTIGNAVATIFAQRLLGATPAAGPPGTDRPTGHTKLQTHPPARRRTLAGQSARVPDDGAPEFAGAAGALYGR